MLYWIHWGGSNGTVTEVAPKDGKVFTLGELQAFVGGYIELVRIPDSGKFVVINEDGVALCLPVNDKVSQHLGFRIVGDALICGMGQVN